MISIAITLTLIEKGGDKKVNHDLNFYKEKYVIDKPITINTNKPNLLKELAKTGPVPGFTSAGASATDVVMGGTEGITTGAAGASVVAGASATEKRKVAPTSADTKNPKKAKTAANKGGIDLEKMADLLTKLKEDDLLGVVQMINDNRTPEMNVKNDVDNGEFTMDLYTLPDTLLKSLWDYVKKRAE